MTFAMLLVSALLFVGIVVLARRRPGAPAAEGRGAPVAPASFRCVGVVAVEPACDAARAIGAARFLPDGAPTLPLPGCSRATCHCRYSDHPDRRADYRRNPYGQGVCMPPAEVGDDRRRGGDRRGAV